MGMQKLKTQLSLCPMSHSEVQDMEQFGVITKNACNLELDVLLDPLQQPEEANAFYELYIEDRIGQLVDVPIVVWNQRDDLGEYPNKAFSMETSRMTKRFVMIDTVSGITESGGYYANSQPKYIRFVENIKLTVQLDPNTEEHIRRPLL